MRVYSISLNESLFISLKIIPTLFLLHKLMRIIPSKTVQLILLLSVRKAAYSLETFVLLVH